MKIKLHYKIPGFGGETYEIIDHIYPADLPDLECYWNSRSCSNVDRWEILPEPITATGASI